MKNAVEYEWVVHEGRFEQADLRKEDAPERLEAYSEQEEKLQQELEENSARLSQAMQDLADARAELNSSDSAHKINALESTVKARQHEQNVVKDKIQQAYNLLRTTVSFANYNDLLPDDFKPLVERSVELWRSGENMLADAWPSEPVSVDKVISELKEQVDSVRKAISRRYEESVIRINDLRSLIQNQKSAVEQLQQGRAPIRHNTRELMELLRRVWHRFHADL